MKLTHTRIATNNVPSLVQFYRKITGISPVEGPTTQPWGNRSMLFRDPDGNLINFFAPVDPDPKSCK